MYPFPTLQTLLNQAASDVNSSQLNGADGFLPRSILGLLAQCQAGYAFGHYDALAYVAKQSNPFTATDEWLEAWASLKKVFRKDATVAGANLLSFAQFTGTVGAPLPLLAPVQRGDGFGYVTMSAGAVGSDGTVTVPIAATTAGSLGNAAQGSVLTLGGGATGINSGGVASTAITGGADQELDADLRTRMLFAYANPPAGGSETDYITWTLAQPGVTRAWCAPNGAGAGTVVVYPMLDVANMQWNGFPQGSNGVATAELRDAAAQGDQLAIANALYPLRPVTAEVFVCSPIAEPINYVIGELAPNTPAIQAGIQTALAAMHLRSAAPGGTTDTGGTLYPSDWNEAVAAVPGIAHFAITSPATAVTPGDGQLLTVGSTTFSST